MVYHLRSNFNADIIDHNRNRKRIFEIARFAQIARKGFRYFCFIHMVIFLTEEEHAKEVKEYLTSTTKLNPAAFQIQIITSIPKNDAGKVLYRELEQLCAE